MIKFNAKTKIKLKKFAVLMAIVIIAFFIKIFLIGNGEPSSENNTVQNMLLSANQPTATPTPDLDYQMLKANYEQEKLILEKRIEALNSKVSRGEIDRKEALKKDLVIQAINKHLGGVFANKGSYIFAICKQYNVNPMMLSAIMKHETANGSSDVCINANNPGGINYFAGCGYSKYGWYQKYPTIEIGIEKMAKLIKENYIDKGRGDIASIGNKYAPPSDPRNGIAGMDNNAWPKFVTNIYINILNDAEKA